MPTLNPEVQTRCGRLRGVDVEGVRVFRGIRYARPPRGALRFRPPERPEPWTGTLDATTPGPAAPQVRLPGLPFASLAARRTGEDCLSLNVFTPGLDDGRRPVLVWIHGGGFLVGSGSTPLYDGRALARRGDVVVVTINYRLGVFGFLDLTSIFGPELKESSNLGLRDQIAALEWVRENIEGFGGDPRNVTLFGQSAGAMSVAALLAAPRARGLFHRAIAQSGAADHVLDRDEAAEVAHTVLAELGGPPADPDSLGRIPVERILQAQHRIMRRLSDPDRLMVYLPSVDGDVLPSQPLDALRAGKGSSVPLLLGTMLDEWKLFRIVDRNLFAVSDGDLLERVERVLSSYPAAPAPHVAVGEYRSALRERGARTGARAVWEAFQSARVFHHPAARLAEAHAASGGTSYADLFTWRPPALRRSLGACHALDLPFLWGFTRHPLLAPLTGLDRSAPRLSRAMQTAWTAFGRSGRPGSSKLPAWEPYEPSRRSTMILGRSCSLDPAPLEAERRLWERWRA